MVLMYLQTNKKQECIISCNASINHDDPPFTIQKLEACIVPCINEKTHGQSTTCPVTEHAASEEVEIQERQVRPPIVIYAYLILRSCITMY